MNRTLAAIPILLVLCAAALAADPIAESEVRAAQQTWGDAIVAIGRAHAAGEDVHSLATQTVAGLYAYDLGPVLFKPTKAAEVGGRENRVSVVFDNLSLRELAETDNLSKIEEQLRKGTGGG